MTEFLHILSSLREQMSATLSRSDVLRPIAWIVGILTTTTVVMLFAKAPDWLLILMATLLVLNIFLYGFAYLFCLLKDRESLRSEKYIG